MSKMKVEIWSDIICPFCYIGKRKLEKAMEQLSYKNQIDVVWHSYQLDPYVKSSPGQDIYSYLAESKGQTIEWAIEAHEQVTQMAKEVGLAYRFDIAKVANTFSAHCLLQCAIEKGLGDEAEELLFKAYFTEGQDLAEVETLLTLGEKIGLDRNELKERISSPETINAVKKDLEEARNIGVKSVPFFVFDRKYAISGAQDPQVFLQTLEKCYAEWSME